MHIANGRYSVSTKFCAAKGHFAMMIPVPRFDSRVGEVEAQHWAGVLARV